MKPFLTPCVLLLCKVKLFHIFILLNRIAKSWWLLLAKHSIVCVVPYIDVNFFEPYIRPLLTGVDQHLSTCWCDRVPGQLSKGINHSIKIKELQHCSYFKIRMIWFRWFVLRNNSNIKMIWWTMVFTSMSIKTLWDRLSYCTSIGGVRDGQTDQ